MTHTEFIVARDRLRFTSESLAAELGLTPAITAAWADGTVAVPSRHARELQWRVAVAERTAALEAGGLPECNWVTAWDAAPLPDEPSAQTEQFEALERHSTSCAACQARERYVNERFPPMPPRPLPGALGVLAAVSAHVDRLPAWARPAAYGALAFSALTAFRVLLTFPRWSAQQGGWLIAGEALAAGAGIGAGVGLVYSG
jgi:hypothetical protein